MPFFTEVEKKTSFLWDLKDLNSQSHLKEIKAESITLPDKAIIIEKYWYWHRNIHKDQQDRAKTLELNHTSTAN